MNAAAARKLCPAVAGSQISFLRLAFSAQFCNGEMWHIRPLLMRSQRSCVEPVMKFSHTVTRVRHPNKNRRRNRDEAFYLAQSNFEGIGMAANLLEKTQHQSRGVAQPGSAPALGAGGRRFKSYRPDQYLLYFQPPREAAILATQNLGPIWVQKALPRA